MAKVIRQNLPNSLISPRAHNPALVVRMVPSSDSLWCLHETCMPSKQCYDHDFTNSTSILALLSFHTSIELWPEFHYEVV